MSLINNPFQAGLHSLSQSQQAKQQAINAFYRNGQKTSVLTAMQQVQQGAQQMMANPYTSTNTSSSLFAITSTAANTTSAVGSAWSSITSNSTQCFERVIERVRNLVYDGEAVNIALPDGSKIDVKKDGSYTIEDKNATVIYRANRIRDFNKYMNVSDRLEEFIDFCGRQGVQRAEMMEIPIKLFIGWLIIEAAKADRENPPSDIQLIPDLRKVVTPRCSGCGRFLPRFAIEKRVPFCAPPCFERHYQRVIPTPALLAAA